MWPLIQTRRDGWLPLSFLVQTLHLLFPKAFCEPGFLLLDIPQVLHSLPPIIFM